MKLIGCLTLAILLTSCENTDGFTYYEYSSMRADTTVFLTITNEDTDSAYLSLNVSECLSHSDQISIHFLKADTILENFSSKEFRPSYFMEDSLEIDPEYIYHFDAGKLGFIFSSDTAIAISFKEKSKLVFETTIEREFFAPSHGLKIPAIKTCLANPAEKH